MKVNSSNFIDIHSHHINSSDNIFQIINSSNTSHNFCFGLHPWDIEKFSFTEVKAKIEGLYQHDHFFALGEIGLDKVCNTRFDKQKEVFIQQLELANQLNIQRIIIHSVKAHSDILEIFTKLKIKQNILIHDYYGSIETANQYLKFNCYFSFGAKLFTNKKAQLALTQLPIARIFFETDDQLEFSIEDIYIKASHLLNLPISSLKEQIYLNLEEF